MMARDVMTGEVQSVTIGVTLRQIARILVDHGISGVPVVDGEGFPIGMVTERDLIAPNAKRESWLMKLAEGEPLSREFLAHLDEANRTAGDVMASPVITISETTDVSDIARLLIEHRIKRLAVVRDRRMVGIVSRADLIRGMAKDPVAAPPPVSFLGGLLSEVISEVEERFTHPDPAPDSEPVGDNKAPVKEARVTAESFRNLVDEFGHQKEHQQDENLRAAAEARKAQVKDLIDHHIGDDKWRDILRRAHAAAMAGQKEMRLLRFPGELCSEGGRAINAPSPDWPQTLRC